MSDDPQDMIQSVIQELKAAMSLQVRTASEEYLEAVLKRDQLEPCVSVLTKHFGEAAKPFDAKSDLSADAQRVADEIGGIRKDQCLYLKDEPSQAYGYAALWPWASDPEQVTLKVGIVERSA